MKKLLTIALFLACFVSCSSDDEDKEEVNKIDLIGTTWEDEYKVCYVEFTSESECQFFITDGYATSLKGLYEYKHPFIYMRQKETGKSIKYKLKVLKNGNIGVCDLDWSEDEVVFEIIKQ